MSGVVMITGIVELVMGQPSPFTSYIVAGDSLPFYQGKTDFGATYLTFRFYCRDPKKFAEPDDIFMSVRAPVFVTNLCDDQTCIGRGIAAIRATGIDRDFLYFHLKKIEAYVESLGSGVIYKAINKLQFAELSINDADIPLLDQKKIAHILSTVQRGIGAQERIIQTTTELKKALMHNLFTESVCKVPQKQTEISLIPVTGRRSYPTSEDFRVAKHLRTRTQNSWKELFHEFCQRTLRCLSSMMSTTTSLRKALKLQARSHTSIQSTAQCAE